jgi:AcrR family transcriptional regulator
MAIEKAPGVGRVQRRQDRTRVGLIAAAQRLFAAKGIEAATIAEIAEEADIAVGSFYNYFESKDALLEALLQSALGEQLGVLRSRQSQVEDPAEKISIAHRHLVELASSEPDLAWLVVRFEVPHRIGLAVLAQAAREDIEACLDLGRFSLDNPEVALQASGGSLLSVVHAILLGQLDPDCGSVHAAGVLRSFGMKPKEAAEIASRDLPPADPSGAEGEE